MPDALSKSAIDKATKELDQTAVAISVVGTSEMKRKALAALAGPVIDALVGTRPQVKALRDDLRRAAHDVKVGSGRARDAAKRVQALSALLKKVQAETKKLGPIRDAIVAGDLVLFNVWGYSDKELDTLLKTLRTADQALQRVGLPSMGGTVILDKQTSFFTYDKPDWKADPVRSAVGGPPLDQVMDAVADREWEKFGSAEQDTWRSRDDFNQAFARYMSGGSVTSETMARLALSVGRNAKRWPT